MKFPLLLSFLFLSFGLSAQEVIPLWDGQPPLCPNQLEMKEEMDARIGVKISHVQTPILEAYFPAKDRANGTSVVICPGGGYSILAWDWEGTSMAKWYNEMGITAFVLRYRLPRYEEDRTCAEQIALADAQQALRLVRARASEWPLAPDRIGLMGFSAGGHLASTAGTHFDAGTAAAADPIAQQSSRPDFLILMYPVVSMDTTIAHGGSRRFLIGEQPSPEKELYFSNEKQVTAQTPPTLLIHADDDKSVLPENSVQFYLALRKHGVPAALHIFQQGGHGFAFGEGKGAVEQWPALCAAWMKELGVL